MINSLFIIIHQVALAIWQFVDRRDYASPGTSVCSMAGQWCQSNCSLLKYIPVKSIEQRKEQIHESTIYWEYKSSVGLLHGLDLAICQFVVIMHLAVASVFDGSPWCQCNCFDDGLQLNKSHWTIYDQLEKSKYIITSQGVPKKEISIGKERMGLLISSG